MRAMGNVPVFCATTEGQTRRIAAEIAATLREQGFVSDVHCLSEPMPAVDWSDVRGVVVGASIHAGRHQKAAVDFVTREAQALVSPPVGVFLGEPERRLPQPRRSRRRSGLGHPFCPPNRLGADSASCRLRGSSRTASTASSPGRSCASSRGGKGLRPTPAATTSSRTGAWCVSSHSMWRRMCSARAAQPSFGLRCDNLGGLGVFPPDGEFPALTGPERLSFRPKPSA